MADGICDICGVRPATVRAQVVSNGQRQTTDLCDVDYRRLARRQGRPSSPLESLFGGAGGSLFDEVFGADFFGGRPPPDGTLPPSARPKGSQAGRPARSGPAAAHRAAGRRAASPSACPPMPRRSFREPRGAPAT